MSSFLRLASLLAALLLLSACTQCAPATSTTTEAVITSGVTRVRVQTAPFALLVDEAAPAAPPSSCPPLFVALRGAREGYIDVTEPFDPAALPLLRAQDATPGAQAGTFEIALVDDTGALQAHASLRAAPGAEGFVDANVLFDLDEADVAFVGACFALDASTHVVGGGERFGGADLRGQITPLVFSAPGDTASGTNEAHAPVPFVATTTGLAVLVETERVAAVDVGASIPGALQWRVHGTSLSLRVRAADTAHLDDVARDVAGARVLDNVAAHARRIGLPPTPPLWALAPMQWRNSLDVQSTDGTITRTGTDVLLDDLAQQRVLALPVSTMWIDAPWESGYNTFVENDVQLPQLDDALATLQARGVHALVWATEHLNVSDDSDQAPGMPPRASLALARRFDDDGLLVKNADGSRFTFPWGRGTGAFVDFTNPAACDAYRALMAPLIARGVRGFKLDYGESMRPDVLGLVDNDIPHFFDGTTTALQHVRYARLYHGCYDDALQAQWPDDHVIITRTGAIYDQARGVAIWPGDLDASFARFHDDSDDGPAVGGLPSAIGGMLSLAMSGYPLFGSDIGGYRGDAPSSELLVRWAQFGAMSTIMQTGGGANFAPWDAVFDQPSTTDAYRVAARLHLDLWPMWQHWIARASRGGDGMPVVVPLGVLVRDDDVKETHLREAAWADRDAFVVGGVLAAYPVVVEGARTREIVLPAGAWWSWWDGSALGDEGAATSTTVSAPLERLPLFVRAGAVLVLGDPRLQSLLPTSDATDLGIDVVGETRVIATSAGPDGSVDAGDVVATQHSDGATTTVHVQTSTARLLIVQLLGTHGASGATVDGAAPTSVANEDELLRCATTCLLVQPDRARVATTAAQVDVVFTR